MELKIDLKKLKESLLSVEEFVYLCLINEGINPDELIWSERNFILPLEHNLYIKPTEEGHLLREKGRQLFSEVETTTFEDFWEQYHKVTKLPKSDKEAASKYWLS